MFYDDTKYLIYLSSDKNLNYSYFISEYHRSSTLQWLHATGSGESAIHVMVFVLSAAITISRVGI